MVGGCEFYWDCMLWGIVGGVMNPDRSVCVEGRSVGSGFYSVLFVGYLEEML